MARKQFPTIADGAFRSPAGPTIGFCDDDVDTTPLYVDLKAYEGRLIEVEVSEDFYVCFVPDDGTTPDRAAAALSSGKFGAAEYKYTLVTSALPRQWVVPAGDSTLVFRTVASSGSGVIIVRRA